jgi:chemotaxis protein methyltransferase CheR
MGHPRGTFVSLLTQLMIEPDLQAQFVQLIANRTGLRIRPQDWATLNRSILERVKALHLKSSQHYYHLLSQSANSPAERSSSAEWDVLTHFITTGESYFWRDRGQLKVLSEHILPELIHTKRAKATQGDRLQLRLWSAGCSTGEEAYTLAMMVQDLIPDFHQWNILILGTDLNPEAIRKAKQGTYRQWSFRQTPVDFRERHFQTTNDTWQVKDAIRQTVAFRYGNLLQDDFPSAGISGMDLILCRNVFIYFHAASIATVLQKFYSTLNPSGYLICGHAELQAQDLSAFQLFSFPEAIVYQRPTGPVQQPVIVSPSPPELYTSIKVPVSIRLRIPSKTAPIHRTDRSPNLPFQTLSPQAPPKLNRPVKTVPAAAAIAPFPPSPETQCEDPMAIAQAYFNQGQSAQALQYCQTALQLDSDAIAPLYLQAQISGAIQDFKLAKILLKKIIYLAPDEVAAYLELGALYLQEGDRHRAKKLYTFAKVLLQEKSNAPIPKYQDFLTIGELSNFIEQQLKKLI